MKVLHVTPSFFPATFWGGPIWSTKAICDGISQIPDMDVRVLTTDAAGPGLGDRVRQRPLPYAVHYARRIAGHSIAPGLLARLPAAVSWADIVHLTGTYSAPTLPTLAWAKLLHKPVVWSPRGALQATTDWANSPHLRAKHVFELGANLLRPARTVLHVTAEAEAAQSRQRLGDIEAVTIPNCVDIPQGCPAKQASRHGCRVITLGRLHPKKGLLELFDAIAHLPDAFTLDVYGTGDAAFVSTLKARADQSGGRIRLRGHVDGARKASAFAEADMFVLPSYSENFGIAVAEAMAHGLPVLTTTATPWAKVAQVGCGRCIDLAKVDLAQEILQLSQGDLPAMGAKARAWMQRDFSPQSMVMAFDELYRDMACLADGRAAA